MPEVVDSLKITPLNPALLEKNFHIVFNGILYPKDNYSNIYAQIVTQNAEQIYTLLQNGSFYNLSYRQIKDNLLTLEKHLSKEEKLLTLNKEKFKVEVFFPCTRYLDPGCLEETLNQRTLIKEVIQENAHVYTRYHTLSDLVNHSSVILYSDTNVLDIALPEYQNLLYLSKLHLADAVAQFDEGHFEKGLTILESERKLIEAFFSPHSKPEIIGINIASLLNQNLDQLLDRLLSKGYFNNHLSDPRIERLFALYNKEEMQAAHRALMKESSLWFASLFIIGLDRVDPAFTLNLSEEDEYLALDWLRLCEYYGSSACIFFPKIETRHQTLAEKYAHKNTVIDEERKAFITILESKKPGKAINQWDTDLQDWQFDRYAQYFKEQGISLSDLIRYLKKDYLIADFVNQFYKEHQRYLTLINSTPTQAQIDDFRKSTTKDFLAIAGDMDHYPLSYITRFNEQQNYHQLVSLKYLIKKNQIQDDNIPAFLSSMKDAAKNTVTHEPYLWNPKTRSLSTPLPAKQRFLPIMIRNAIEKDKNITRFIVWMD